MGAFNGTSLTSVTFQGTVPEAGFHEWAFSNPRQSIGDVREKYLAGGQGRYTRASGGMEWTKQ
jgi:hypothetical protein